MGNKRRKRSILFVGLTMTMRGPRGGYNYMFWRTHQQGKKTYTNTLKSGKATWYESVHACVLSTEYEMPCMLCTTV
jgi:hypothetical protein